MNIKDILDGVVSHALSLGLFDSVDYQEPNASPGKGINAYFWVNSVRPSLSGLDATSVRLELTMQMYSHMLQEPSAQIDINLLEAYDELMKVYTSDFSLGGLVRNIDLLGQEGEPMSMTTGYVDLDDNSFRVFTLTLPLIVDDVWSQNDA